MSDKFSLIDRIRHRKVKQLRSIGVDEIACLIDFGIETDSVMAGLRYLNQLRQMVNQAVQEARIESSGPDLF